MDRTYTVLTINDKEYAIIDEMLYNNINYIYAVNLNNEEDILVRKRVYENGKDVLYGLDSNEEFDSVLKGFVKRQNN